MIKTLAIVLIMLGEGLNQFKDKKTKKKFNNRKINAIIINN
jgi:hypothetical protein